MKNNLGDNKLVIFKLEMIGYVQRNVFVFVFYVLHDFPANVQLMGSWFRIQTQNVSKILSPATKKKIAWLLHNYKAKSYRTKWKTKKKRTHKILVPGIPRKQ